jgi:spore coat polysaccharide biosynthesis protein SpsF
MKILCTIEARMRSSRLPGKILKPLLGKPMLERMVERLQRARTVDGIVIATTDSPLDDATEAAARAMGVGCFRGSEDDVLARVLGAARAYHGDLIVETTGDSPLIDPGLLDKVVADYCMGGADFVSSSLTGYTTPIGTDVRVFSTAALAEVDALTRDPADREHVSLYFWTHPERYRLRNVPSELGPEAVKPRLTVDTADDFELVRRIYEALLPTRPAFTLGDVLNLLQAHPDWLALNQHVPQRAAR